VERIVKRSKEPLVWALFSSGGMLAALALPALALVLWFAIPLGWVAAPSYGALVAAIGHPVAKLALLCTVTLWSFHWGHRFRYTLYDGLQLSHLYGMIATECYGGAAALSLLAAWVLWTFPSA
jgi:fumarate reductase subunit D